MNAYLLDSYIEIFMTVMTVLTLASAFFCFYLYQNRKNIEQRDKKHEYQIELREVIINRMGELVISVDAVTGEIVWVNDATVQFMEEPRQKILGMRIENLQLANVDQETITEMELSLRQGQEWRGYVEFIHGSKKIPHELSLFPYGSISDKRLFIIARNIQEQIEERQDRKGDRETISEIESLGKLGYWELFNENKKITWSRGLYSVLGYEINSIKPNLDFLYKMILPEDQGASNKAFVKAFQNQEAVDQLLRIENHKGEQLRILLRIRHRFDRKNNLISTIGFMQDITEFENLESSLDYAESLSRAILDHSDLLLFVMDEKRQLVVVNHSIENLLGKTEEEIIGTDAMLYFSDIIEENKNRFSNVHFFEGIVEMPAHQYGNRFVRWSLSKFVTQDGRNLTVAMGFDMTQSELAKRKMQKKANEDTVTGLLNEKSFKKEVNAYLIKSRFSPVRPICLVCIQMKGIFHNAALPHRKEVLYVIRKESERLRHLFGESILLSYFGADCFYVFLANKNQQDVEKISEELLSILTKPVKLEDKSFVPQIRIAAVEADSGEIRESELFAALDQTLANGREQNHMVQIEGFYAGSE